MNAHNKPAPVAKRFSPWRLLLPLFLAVASAASYWDLREFEHEQQPLLQALEVGAQANLRLLAGQAEILASRPGALATTRALGASLPDLINSLHQPPDHTLTPPPPSLRVLRELWQRAAGQVATMNRLAPKQQKLMLDAQRLQNIANSLMVISDAIVDALVAAQAQLKEIRVASRQLMLLQRMSANLRRILEPDSNLLVAVDRLGRDALVFGNVTTGLENGSPQLGIERVTDANARDILTSAGRDFRNLVQAVEAVISGAEARGRLQEAILELRPTLQAIDTQIRFLHQRLDEREKNRLLQPFHVLVLASLTCVSVFVALILGFGDRRARTRQWLESHRQWREIEEDLESQRRALSSDLEGLANQVHRLADGDLGLGGSGSKSTESAASLAWSGLERLRQRLSEHAKTGLRVAQAGKLVNDVGMRLQDISRRQYQQVEDSGRATRVMAAAMENIAEQAGEMSGVLRDSQVNAGRASQTLEQTQQELTAAQASAEDCAERVRRLEDAARQLHALRDLVEDVSELGKLLSLNVAIQASVDSPASQALANFSAEVSRLSARARSAQVQIESVEAELRNEAARAASAVKENVWRTRGAAERVRGARNAVDELDRAARTLEEMNQTLAKNYREHAVNVTEVVRAVTGLHGLSAQVREQIEASLDASGTLADSALQLQHRLGGSEPDPAEVMTFGTQQATPQDTAPATVTDKPARRLKLWT